MGMFDWLTCKYKLDDPSHNALRYQTKSTPAQALDEYEIREDGSLWYQEYDARWIEEPASLLGGYVEHYNQRWVKTYLTKEIRFYANAKDSKQDTDWVEYSAYFRNGELQQMNRIE